MAFQFPVRIYWEDTDAGGIVFYANYLKFFERARTEWLRTFGLSQQALKTGTADIGAANGTGGGMFVVTEVSLRYLCPARLDDQLVVSAAVQQAGRASLLLAQQARLQDASQQLLCEGQVRLGWVDALTLRPARIPPALLEKLCP